MNQKVLDQKINEYSEKTGYSVAKVRGNVVSFHLPNGNLKTVTFNTEKGMTQQHFKDQCDINRILKKFAETGTLTHINRNPAVFLDHVGLPDFAEAQKIVHEAREEFLNLPSEVRTRFGNSPQELINFLKDPQNDDEAVKMRLKRRPEVKKDPALETLKSIDKSLKLKPKPSGDA